MTRSENDLRAALHELEQRADQQGAPSTEVIIATVDAARNRPHPVPRPSHLRRWLAPLATAALVAVAALTAVTLTGGQHAPSQEGRGPASTTNPSITQPSNTSPARPSTSPRQDLSTVKPKPNPTAAAASVLDDAAATLAAQPWTAPHPDQFFYVHTTKATTWTSVSGITAGYGQTSDGRPILIDGCIHGQAVHGHPVPASYCSTHRGARYLAAAPTTRSAWNAYLERLDPGAKTANTQGKIIAQVLHDDLLSPTAAAALLRYTTFCLGLRTLAVAPVQGNALVGITCTSMANGSYGLVFDATTHNFTGFVAVDHQTGKATGAAEIVLKTGIVSKVGQRP